MSGGSPGSHTALPPTTHPTPLNTHHPSHPLPSPPPQMDFCLRFDCANLRALWDGLSPEVGAPVREGAGQGCGSPVCMASGALAHLLLKLTSTSCPSASCLSTPSSIFHFRSLKRLCASCAPIHAGAGDVPLRMGARGG